MKQPAPRDKKIEHLKKANLFLKGSMDSCEICPRRCRADRAAGKRGFCRAGPDPVVYSHGPHHGEEPPLSGTKGSGTIFFSHCSMKCVYCQNYYFSQLDQGRTVSANRLAEMMLGLEAQGCHNINLVSPTHFVPQILLALESALEKGLTVPLVYNTSGYELPETIRLLDGIVDIYLPDMRYSDDTMAKRYSNADSYVGFDRQSVRIMHGQVGDLVLDGRGIGVKGLIIRLLALPHDISGTVQTLRYIKEAISQNTYLSIMSQYYPTFKAYNYSELSRGVIGAEYKNIVDASRDLGLNNGWVQESPKESPEDSDPTFFGTNIPPR